MQALAVRLSCWDLIWHRWPPCQGTPHSCQLAALNQGQHTLKERPLRWHPPARTHLRKANSHRLLHKQQGLPALLPRPGSALKARQQMHLLQATQPRCGTHGSLPLAWPDLRLLLDLQTLVASIVGSAWVWGQSRLSTCLQSVDRPHAGLCRSADSVQSALAV